MWQAEVDTELTQSASPATAVGQILLEYGSCFSLRESMVNNAGLRQKCRNGHLVQNCDTYHVRMLPKLGRTKQFHNTQRAVSGLACLPKNCFVEVKVAMFPDEVRTWTRDPFPAWGPMVPVVPLSVPAKGGSSEGLEERLLMT